MPTELRKITSLTWRRLITSEHGIEGMLVLRERGPNIGSGDPHQIIFNAGRVEGYKECINNIMDLIAAEEQKQSDTENP